MKPYKITMRDYIEDAIAFAFIILAIIAAVAILVMLMP